MTDLYDFTHIPDKKPQNILNPWRTQIIFKKEIYIKYIFTVDFWTVCGIFGMSCPVIQEKGEQNKAWKKKNSQ